jgi:DNA-binding MarR family transcriptional regulator
MESAAAPDVELPPSALIRPFTSTPPNLSWLSIRMEQVAQVSRAKDADDARVVSLALTEPGWKALEGATPLVFDAERELLADFTHDERRLLADLLSGWSHQHPDNKPDRPRPHLPSIRDPSDTPSRRTHCSSSPGTF